MNWIRWIYGGKRRVLKGPLVDEHGSQYGTLGAYGEAYTGISKKYVIATGKVLQVNYPDGLILKRNWIRALLNPDFMDVKPWNIRHGLTCNKVDSSQEY